MFTWLMAACLFCEPGEQVFYEGDTMRGIYTYKPVEEGHCLIVPKRHVESFEELTDKECAELCRVIKKVDKAVKSIYGTTAYMLLEANGEEALQEVPHVHFHYIPRAAGEKSTVPFLAWLLARSLYDPITGGELQIAVEQLSSVIEHDPLQAHHHHH